MTEPTAGRPVGRVGRAHGRDGSFYLDHARRAPEVGERLDVGGRALRVERRAGTDSRPIVRLSDVGDRNAAAALRGVMLSEVGPGPEPVEGEWRVEDLVGCRVDGLGDVRRVLAAPSCDVLEVGEGAILVPLVRDAVRRVDTGARRIEVNRAFIGLAEDQDEPDGHAPAAAQGRDATP